MRPSLGGRGQGEAPFPSDMRLRYRCSFMKARGSTAQRTSRAKLSLGKFSAVVLASLVVLLAVWVVVASRGPGFATQIVGRHPVDPLDAEEHSAVVQPIGTGQSTAPKTTP